MTKRAKVAHGIAINIYLSTQVWHGANKNISRRRDVDLSTNMYI